MVSTLRIRKDSDNILRHQKLYIATIDPLGGLTSALRAPNKIDPSGLQKVLLHHFFSSHACHYRRIEQCRLHFPGQQVFWASSPVVTKTPPPPLKADEAALCSHET